MKFLLSSLIVLFTFIGFTQSEEFAFPDKESSFPGGAAEMRKFIALETRYPEVSRQNWDQGRVYVQFVVERDGTLTHIKIYGDGLTPELNAEAIRLVASMPRWTPSELNGEAVRANCRMPISFTLQGRRSRRFRRR